MCSHCGRIVKSDPPAGTGEPIHEMNIEADPALSPYPPRHAVIKTLVGFGIFALLFLSQMLRGYPLLSILMGIASGAVALWGFIEISMWAMDRFDHSGSREDPEEEVDAELDDAYPDAPVKGLESTPGSFADLDREIDAKPVVSKVAKDVRDGKATKSEDLFASMVSGSAKTTDATEKAGEEDPADLRPDESLVNREEQAEALERAKNAQSLVQFLEEGITQEITRVEKKLLKAPRNVSLLMRLAQLHEEQGNTAKAAEVMDACASENPQVPEVFLYQGMILRKTGEGLRARTAFEKALRLNRFMSKAYYQLGVLERSLKNLAGSRETLQKCIQLSPDDAYAHYQLGMVYRETGELQLALMELRRACMLNPGDSYGHSQLGQIFQQTRHFDAAIAEYSQALSLKPNDVFVLEKLAETLTEKGDLARAQEIYQEALSHQFHPEMHTLLALAKILHRLGKWSELTPVATEILNLSPGHADGLYYQALCALDRRNTDLAFESLRKMTTTAPERWEGWFELGKMFQGMEQPDQALAAFMKAAPNAADQAGIWNTIGILLSNRKDYEGALKALRKAVSFDYTDAQIQANYKAVLKKIDSACQRSIELNTEKLTADPQALDCYLDLGKAYELLDRPDEALMAYQRLLSIKADHIGGLLAYARILREKGKLKMAMRCFREILKIQPDNLDAGIHLIQGYLNMGFLNEALRLATSVQKLAPEDPRLHFLLGKIYFTKGLAGRALKEFSIVTETSRDPDMVGWAELMRRRLSKTS
jgi:tetratricopeptide (TPR) repeat protein